MARSVSFLGKREEIGHGEFEFDFVGHGFYGRKNG